MTPLTSGGLTLSWRSTCGCTRRGGHPQALGCGWRCWAVIGQVRPLFHFRSHSHGLLTPASWDGLGGGQTMMGTGREAAVPSEAPSIQNRTAPPPALCSTLFNLKPQALPPPDLGQFLKGSALSILKDRFSYSTPSLSKTNRNYTPPTQIQLDPDSSGQRAVAVDLGKGKKKKTLLMIIK